MANLFEMFGLKNPLASTGWSQPDWLATANAVLDDVDSFDVVNVGGRLEFVFDGSGEISSDQGQQRVAFATKSSIFKGAGRPLSASATQRAATFLGVDVPSIRAVAKIESRGRSYLTNGALEILYEAHKFSAETGHKFDASHPNLSSRNWNRSLYGKGGMNQIDRIERAMKLNEVAALRSASYGAFQILGSNHGACGFANVHDMVRTLAGGEDENLLAFSAFVKAHPKMHRALQKRDWTTFALAYNGPGMRANQYDTKLAAAYRSFGGGA